ncbi:hypothetical protein H6F75_00055 [Nodosilinea sp. FACHB-131]|uniref:hypothetical protein n=1 Tax=Cyanophyceae TaxID=3028117 RepID=UPI001683CDBF|nr:hypothetical protein [Nodosilinea sp. FACHB-131]MBD1871862.1 hypothetical protein [Nodosilinea sp. FACHB-131]
MTQSSDRLDRMEALLAITIEGLARTEKITESNARAIEAWGGRIEEGEQKNQTQLEASIADTVAMIADMGQQQQEAVQRAEQQKVEADQRFEVFLAEARADRAEMRAAREQWQIEAQANATEHRAFTQNIQVLLAEIARLWQRVAG